MIGKSLVQNDQDTIDEGYASEISIAQLIGELGVLQFNNSNFRRFAQSGEAAKKEYIATVEDIQEFLNKQNLDNEDEELAVQNVQKIILTVLETPYDSLSSRLAYRDCLTVFRSFYGSILLPQKG